MMFETADETGRISPREYCQLATRPVTGYGYSRLPQGLLQAEQAFNRADKTAAVGVNRVLCRSLLDDFRLEDSAWTMPNTLRSLYQAQLERIEGNLKSKDDSYFSLTHDPFLKDLAILRHRLIPFGAELATPNSGIPRNLMWRGGWRQASKYIRVIASCRGMQPFLELHMHPQCTDAFNPEGWIETYENLADFLTSNPVFLGVQSTSWFLDPALEQVSPHLAYLRQDSERCGAVILYAGEDDDGHSGALATSKNRRALYAAGRYRPRRFTRIWPRREFLQRRWRKPVSP